MSTVELPPVAAAPSPEVLGTRRHGRKGKVFSHPEDVHCVVYNLFTLAAYGVAFTAYLNPEAAGLTSIWAIAAYVVVANVLLGWISGVNVGVNYHNHVHLKVFHSAWLNRVFEHIWPITGGWPPYMWKHSHVTVHHANVLGETDWTVPRRKADGTFENIWVYLFMHWPWRYAQHLFEDFRNQRGGKRVRRKFLIDLAIFLPLYSIPFFIDPWMGLFLWLMPHFFANTITGGGMYVQHVGCEAPTEEHPYWHSNTFRSRFFNLTMFNIGYHTLHHCYAQIHWSELPEVQKRVDDAMKKDGVTSLSVGYYHTFANLAAGRTWERTKSDYSTVD